MFLNKLPLTPKGELRLIVTPLTPEGGLRLKIVISFNPVP
jgi:hypothetical protein